ncbi:tRNA (adenine57-N1/adenine58-N1)-methyltransferase catalytic subunit [Giardia muris]|uniref:tRNA (adenine(58)-N(1))-methyltransferase n=1 Tax=Giardia muris TaxID=5742 RepID=A0A4Z1TC14_GIAMU|nr:tRNA (adenine57-N1/adenine58-N1)-methyltransferase catalytic subunit [Giardia muris]|eukprot:TNJ30011.1 tRNA (adenine57-N1/adenine58-N1)-methyltransferase catalytic subunit [Giardia muris]
MSRELLLRTVQEAASNGYLLTVDTTTNVLTCAEGCAYQAFVHDVEGVWELVIKADHTCSNPSVSPLPKGFSPPLNDERSLIAYGDSVIFVSGNDNLTLARIVNDGCYQSCYGEFQHSSLIGQPYGAKLFSKNRTGFIFVLRFTPSLWSRVLERRTQIVFTPDVASIFLRVGLRPGMRVCEAGTGSGSLSHHLVHCIYPHGHLYTFDINPERPVLLKQDMNNNYHTEAVTSIVTAQHRNVCDEGFPPELTNIDFVFLDLPEPGSVIEKLPRTVTVGSKLCVFVPCLEQIHMAIQACVRAGFGAFEVMKTFLIAYELSSRKLAAPPLRHLGKNTDGVKRRAGARTASAENIQDSKVFSEIRPTQLMRTHTGFLLFSIYNGQPFQSDEATLDDQKNADC